MLWALERRFILTSNYILQSAIQSEGLKRGLEENSTRCNNEGTQDEDGSSETPMELANSNEPVASYEKILPQSVRKYFISIDHCYAGTMDLTRKKCVTCGSVSNYSTYLSMKFLLKDSRLCVSAYRWYTSIFQRMMLLAILNLWVLTLGFLTRTVPILKTFLLRQTQRGQYSLVKKQSVRCMLC